MKKWRNAKGRERKKQPQTNSACTSSSFKRINIHVSISNHCTVIINCFAAKLSAISLNSSYDFRLIKLCKTNWKNPLQLLRKSLLSKLSANQICSMLTLHGWGKCVTLVQMSTSTACCDSLSFPLRDHHSWGSQNSCSGFFLLRCCSLCAQQHHRKPPAQKSKIKNRCFSFTLQEAAYFCTSHGLTDLCKSESVWWGKEKWKYCFWHFFSVSPLKGTL